MAENPKLPEDSDDAGVLVFDDLEVDSDQWTVSKVKDPLTAAQRADFESRRQRVAEACRSCHVSNRFFPEIRDNQDNDLVPDMLMTKSEDAYLDVLELERALAARKAARHGAA